MSLWLYYAYVGTLPTLELCTWPRTHPPLPVLGGGETWKPEEGLEIPASVAARGMKGAPARQEPRSHDPLWAT